jgi:hypothetical protein
LKAKSADTALKKALDDYAAVAGQPADDAKTQAAARSAIEAVLVAEQTLAGQYWTDPKFQSAVRAQSPGT